jgi:hypothetical protein
VAFVDPEKLMVESKEKISPSVIMKAVWPALVVLLLTLLVSTFFTEFTFVSGMKSLWLVLLRFFRLFIVLVLPMFLLSRIYLITGRFFHVRSWALVQIQDERHRTINPLQNWLLRPFQGIGLSMLIATKLIFFLGIYTGAGIDTSVVLPPPAFQLSRFLATTAIAVAISLLLSYLWGLDDLGVRLHNHKTQEIRMIGKYVGVILPVLFGLYGMISILKNYSLMMTFQYLAQMIVILYPPFLVFSVMHAFYLQRNEAMLLEKLKVMSMVNLSDMGKSISRQ